MRISPGLGHDDGFDPLLAEIAAAPDAMLATEARRRLLIAYCVRSAATAATRPGDMGQENRQIDSLKPAQADVCTSNELARRLGLHIATIRALADDDAIPGRLCRVSPPRFSWRVVYESIGGSGTADGQVVSLRGLAQRYRVTPRKVRDACAEGRLRGAKIGGKWLFAVNAVPAKLPPHQRKKISAATLAVRELHVAVVKERQLAAAHALDIFRDHCAAFSPAQAEAARLLNRNPGMSPAQLAAMADPPCSAQAMEHRLIRLVSTVRSQNR